MNKVVVAGVDEGRPLTEFPPGTFLVVTTDHWNIRKGTICLVLLKDPQGRQEFVDLSHPEVTQRFCDDGCVNGVAIQPGQWFSVTVGEAG